MRETEKNQIYKKDIKYFMNTKSYNRLSESDELDFNLPD